MDIDRDQAPNHFMTPIPFEVGRGRLRFLAKTVGLADPVPFELNAARSDGATR